MTDVLTQALQAWNECESIDDEDVRRTWATTLSQTEAFSIAQVVAITGAPLWFVQIDWPKSVKTGGRFNPEALPLILDLQTAHHNGERPKDLVRTIIKQGVSPIVLSRLTGIPSANLKRWAKP